MLKGLISSQKPLLAITHASMGPMLQHEPVMQYALTRSVAAGDAALAKNVRLRQGQAHNAMQDKKASETGSRWSRVWLPHSFGACCWLQNMRLWFIVHGSALSCHGHSKDGSAEKTRTPFVSFNQKKKFLHCLSWLLERLVLYHAIRTNLAMVLLQ